MTEKTGKYTASMKRAYSPRIDRKQVKILRKVTRTPKL